MLNTFSKEYTTGALPGQGRPANRPAWRGPALAFLQSHGSRMLHTPGSRIRSTALERAAASRSEAKYPEAGITDARLRALRRRLERAGWRSGIELIATQPDPVLAEPVRIRLLAPPRGGDTVLILEYADGSGMVFTQGFAPAGFGTDNRKQGQGGNAGPGMDTRGDGWS